MAITTRPDNFEQQEAVLVYSDAPDNVEAIRQIDAWARDQGFVRTREYHLNVVQTAEGRRLFQGTCYRLTPEHALAADADMERIRERREKMPMTTPADALLRGE